jgi:NAD(P)-dependent dehydrogenase (short-subunit alcohol dehydrogenase family)
MMSTVLITGCSSGFGELTARTLAAAGHCVYASMRSAAQRNAAAAERLRGWADRAGFALQVIELDVLDSASVQQAVQRILAAEGALDVVVNNAAVSAAGPLEAFDVGQMADVLDVNVLGPMRVSKVALPGMRARRAGLLIWVTSTLGRVLPYGGGLYPASKWAAEGFAESLHYELRPFGVDVAILEPGCFPTPALSKSMVAADSEVAAEYRALAQAPPTVEPDSAGLRADS